MHKLGEFNTQENILLSGSDNIPAVDPLVPENVKARGEDHKEDNHDAEEDEGDGAEGNLLQNLSLPIFLI